MSVDEVIGSRLFEIRASCGRGGREPESLEAFAERVKRATGVDYNPTTLSMMERGKRRWLVSDVATFALVDPEDRGRVWLAGFDLPQEKPVIVGTIQPDMPPDAKMEPVRPAARKVAERPSEAEAAPGKGKRR